MKYTAVILLALNFILFGQIKNPFISKDINKITVKDTVTDMFPLQTGNYWDYNAFDSTGSPFTAIREITGDTIINNKTYKIVCLKGVSNTHNEIIYTEYLRKDSLGNIYTYINKDTLLYNIHLNVGDVYPSPFPDIYYKIGNIYNINIFGQNSIVIVYYLFTSNNTSMGYEALAENFGIIDLSAKRYNTTAFLQIWGAVLKNVRYGELLAKDTVDWEEYYPLKKGNWWKYDNQHYPGIYEYIKRTVLGDTLINGKQMKVIEEVIAGGPFPGVDKYFLYFQDNILYCYDTYSDTSNVYLRFTQKLNDTLKIDSYSYIVTKEKSFTSHYFTGENTYSIKIARIQAAMADFTFIKGLGCIHESYEGATGGAGLIGAYVNGVYYGDTTALGINENGGVQKECYMLGQNYPNPFNPLTTINYQTPKSGNVTIKVYDILGNELKTLVNEYKSAGVYSTIFDGSNFSSGVYFYVIKAGNFIQTKKMMLMK
jgi:hypothetical protein